ncbi:serine hydrolase [Aeromicrobium sp. P5_D10]
MTTRPFGLDDVRRIVTVPETAISADGTSVVFTRREVMSGRSVTSLWEVSEGGDARPLTQTGTDRAPVSAPSGIFFLRDVADVPQLHLLPRRGEPIQLTTGSTGAGPAVPSPDGSRVAFVSSVGTDPTQQHAPIVVDTLDQLVDGVGWTGIRRHLFVLDLATRGVRQITDGDYDVNDPAWSPDGVRIAFIAGLDPRADVTLQRRACSVEVDDPLAPVERFGDATGLGGPVIWSPDGESVIAVGSKSADDGHAHLLRLHRDGRPDDDLTAGIDRNVMPGSTGYPGGRPALTPDGLHIIFCVRDQGWTHLYSVGLDGQAPRGVVAQPHQVVSALSVSANASRAAVVLTTQESFAEVAIVDLVSGEVRVMTALKDESLADVELYRPQPRQFQISDGTVVHGWLMEAEGATGAAPLILDVHGGPHNAWSGVADEIHLYQQLLVARGWRVLMINPRGSDGYGEDFYQAVNGGWGRVDLQDFLEPIDQLVAEGVADADRLAVTGYSYGGITTCALTTHTDRFAAAVAGGLICDFVAVAVQQIPEGYFSSLAVGVPPTDTARLAEASPISRVAQVSTPTLVLHGDEDHTCPVDQAQEWFSALRHQGVPTRLVVYPSGGHLFIADGPIDHRIDYHARVVEWVELNVRSSPRPSALSPAPRGRTYWQRRLDLLRKRHAVVGAQLGIVQLTENGVPFDRVTVGSGLLDASTGEPVIDDAVFQIGSITKVWTTMLVMQLVEEGLLNLEGRVRDVLPDFTLADSPTPDVTVRALLNHTSGIDGDVFTDTGQGCDCVRLYVDQLASVEHLYPSGERFSYCNSAFVIAGRIVEVLRDMTWEEAVRRYLIEPMGLKHTIASSDEAARFAAATGHTLDGDTPVPVPQWSIARSMGPAGLITASVGDLLTFAETALRAGVTPDGGRILSAESAALMTEENVDLSESVVTKDGWGLGWFLEDWGGTFAYGHDGGTIGQRAYLRLFPDAGYAVALLTTGGRADGLYTELFSDIASSIDGSILPPRVRADHARTPAPVEGTWICAGMRAQVRPMGERLELTMTDLMGIVHGAPPASPTTVTLYPSTTPDVYAFTTPDLAGWEQLRVVPGGMYIGARFLKEVKS